MRATPRRSAALSASGASKLAEYVLDGLIPPDYDPRGESEHEKRSSLEAMAYLTWMRKNMNACGNRHPETCRSMFLMRKDLTWRPPDLEVGSLGGPFPSVVAAPGFQKALVRVDKSIGPLFGSNRDLPHGDAWEGPESDEDVPPPAEVS